MLKYCPILSLLLLVCLVLCRAAMLKRCGIQVFHFGETHRSDWLLPPLVAFVLYHILANTFDWPRVSGPELVDWPWLGYVGLAFCVLGLGLFLWGLISFRTSFRVGIDPEAPGRLITTGAFGVSRNPLYVAFGLNLAGFFMVFPNLFFLFVLLAGCWLFRRQAIREEEFLRAEFGEEYETYRKRVRRFL